MELLLACQPKRSVTVVAEVVCLVRQPDRFAQAALAFGTPVLAVPDQAQLAP
jgi:hypothetical protein